MTTEADVFFRSPELRAEIARGKLPAGHDPCRDAYDSLMKAFTERRGPFDLARFRPPSSTGGTRSDFMVRLAMMRRAIQGGDTMLIRLLRDIGHSREHLDHAMAHWRAEHLGAARRRPVNTFFG